MASLFNPTKLLRKIQLGHPPVEIIVPQPWHKHLSDFFEKQLGYRRLRGDTSLFGKSFSDNSFVVVAVEVDNMAIFTSNDERLFELETQLKRAFDGTDFGPLSSFFGILFQWNLSTHSYISSAQKQMDSFYAKHPKLAGLRGSEYPSPLKITVDENSPPKRKNNMS